MPAQFFSQELFVRLKLLLLGACELGGDGDYPRGQSWSPNATAAQVGAVMRAAAVGQKG